MKQTIIIRTATEADFAALLTIYGTYVTTTAVTFEYEPPSLEVFSKRMTSHLQKYPFLVAEEEGHILGYAYASPFRQYEAYDWTVETTIYLDPSARGKGVGRKLYAALEEQLKAQNRVQMVACIAWTDQEDEYLTHASPRFHEKLGFAKVAHFPKCGYKFNRWYDVVWLRKTLVEEFPTPPKPINGGIS